MNKLVKVTFFLKVTGSFLEVIRVTLKAFDDFKNKQQKCMK